MTKLRSPLTYELALTRIAGATGWPKVEEITGRSERTLRQWSEEGIKPNAGEMISLDLAEKLDAAYHDAGGDGFPMLDCFATRLNTSLAAAAPAQLARCAAIAAKEGGEAIAATIAASIPGASDAERARAELELEESIAAQTNTLATLRAGRKATVSIPGEGN